MTFLESEQFGVWRIMSSIRRRAYKTACFNHVEFSTWYRQRLQT